MVVVENWRLECNGGGELGSSLGSGEEGCGGGLPGIKVGGGQGCRL